MDRILTIVLFVWGHAEHIPYTKGHLKCKNCKFWQNTWHYKSFFKLPSVPWHARVWICKSQVLFHDTVNIQTIFFVQVCNFYRSRRYRLVHILGLDNESQTRTDERRLISVELCLDLKIDEEIGTITWIRWPLTEYQKISTKRRKKFGKQSKW